MFPLGERKNLASLASAGEATVSVTAMLRRRERRMGPYYTRRAAIHTPGIPADASTAAVAAAVYARRSVNERRSAPNGDDLPSGPTSPSIAATWADTLRRHRSAVTKPDRSVLSLLYDSSGRTTRLFNPC